VCQSRLYPVSASSNGALAGTSFRGAQLEGHAHGEQITAAITAADGGGDEDPVDLR
jgi:hypothetical protein